MQSGLATLQWWRSGTCSACPFVQSYDCPAFGLRFQHELAYNRPMDRWKARLACRAFLCLIAAVLGDGSTLSPRIAKVIKETMIEVQTTNNQNAVPVVEDLSRLKPRPDIRNIAIIAHVDHGKTTLVDGMLRQTKVFRDNQAVVERIMDSNDLERERGITILAKNTSVEYKGITINLVDTPGHADFGGEVERIMNMVDGVLLLVDAVEGPMPQTRFVLRQALEKGLKAIVVVNKVDRLASRPDYVVNGTFDLFIDLGATEEQAEFPVVYTVAIDGRAGLDPDNLEPTLEPLFDAILDFLPPPLVDLDGSTQLLVTTLEYSNYVGKIAVGRLRSGTIRTGQQIARVNPAGQVEIGKVSQVYTFHNLQRMPQAEVQAGNIVAVAGLENAGIGDTLTDPNDIRPLPPITVEEPTVRMTFAVNDSPFAGPGRTIPHQPPDPRSSVE